MRTKTMLLSALLGTLGSVSLMAQSSNVYSINAVGYINVSLVPNAFNIISCPLIASPDNTLNTLLSATNGTLKGFKFYPWTNIGGVNTYGASDTAAATKWAGGGNETLNPGQAGFLFVPSTATVTNFTFVGTVPSGSLSNYLTPGFNLVSSVLPTTGLLTNGLLSFNGQHYGDKAYTYDATTGGYTSYAVKPNGAWAVTPNLASLGNGFFYYLSNTTVTDIWVESFSVGP